MNTEKLKNKYVSPSAVFYLYTFINFSINKLITYSLLSTKASATKAKMQTKNPDQMGIKKALL
jgi:hypothetical protein